MDSGTYTAITSPRMVMIPSAMIHSSMMTLRSLSFSLWRRFSSLLILWQVLDGIALAHIGNLFFVLVNLARWKKVDAESAVR